MAQVLEGLMGLAQRTGAVRVRTGPKDAALRAARVCYDHLAGERGVALMRGLMDNGWISGDAEPLVTEAGRRRLVDKSRQPGESRAPARYPQSGKRGGYRWPAKPKYRVSKACSTVILA